MKPLATNRQVLTWLCICPSDQNTSALKKTFFTILALVSFALVFSFLVSSIVFFLKNVSIDLENGLYALVQIACSFDSVYMFAVVFISRKKINRFLQTLVTIYEESKLKKFISWASNFSNFILINFRFRSGVFATFETCKWQKWNTLEILYPICNGWLSNQHDRNGSGIGSLLSFNRERIRLQIPILSI